MFQTPTVRTWCGMTMLENEGCQSLLGTVVVECKRCFLMNDMFKWCTLSCVSTPLWQLMLLFCFPTLPLPFCSFSLALSSWRVILTRRIIHFQTESNPDMIKYLCKLHSHCSNTYRALSTQQLFHNQQSLLTVCVSLCVTVCMCVHVNKSVWCDSW